MFNIGVFFIRGIKNKLIYFLELIQLIIYVFEQFLFKGKERKIIKPIIYKQILFTGFDALRLIGIIALVFGGMIIFMVDNLSQTLFFNKSLLGTLMSRILLPEVAPLLTAIIVIGRSGTAIATEIGNMKVNNEIEALESMGIDPYHFLIAPRMLGMIASLVLLVIYFFFIGMIGGYLVANLFMGVKLPFDEYVQIVFQSMELADIGMALLKSFFFGLFISAIACYKGLAIPKSITFVPITASQTVVSGMTTVFLLYAYLTVLYYL
ncbi:MAG TPA: ABC transporter permease [Spirochaetia bacterium]|nr:MAG: hypothetical protein A2Y41_08090 [Spirochaetes bacterium GWB1_36_13]HCL56900.1 ABC transporter permease [Spirochaetia bacterium]